MRRILTILLSFALVMFTASTCDKESFRLYRDTDGNSTLLTGGAWGLVETQYWTAGVVETRPNVPQTLMEFREDGIGATLEIQSDGSRKEIGVFHYEKYPGAITILNEEEYRNHQQYTQEDSQYMPGKTYYFKVIDYDTISSKETVSSGSYLVNIFARL